MRDWLTAETLYAEILLLKAQGKAIFLVEGPGDVGALEAHVADEECFLIPGDGRENVDGAIALVDCNRLSGVLALLDRDWAGVLDQESDSPNIVYTDLYDLDATILMAGSTCGRVLASFCDRKRLARHVAASGAGSPLNLILDTAVAVGVLRLISRRDGLGLNLRQFPVQEIIDLSNGSVDVRKLVLIALHRSGCSGQDVDSICSEVRRITDLIGPSPRYCSGHDLISLLAVMMRKKWGSMVGADVLARAVRAALAPGDLSRTALYDGVSRWATAQGLTVWG